MCPAEVHKFCVLDETGQALMQAAMNQLQISACAYRRVLMLAHTIAKVWAMQAPAGEHCGTSWRPAHPIRGDTGGREDCHGRMREVLQKANTLPGVSKPILQGAHDRCYKTIRNNGKNGKKDAQEWRVMRSLAVSPISSAVVL
jgi:hypothetical protein